MCMFVLWTLDIILSIGKLNTRQTIFKYVIDLIFYNLLDSDNNCFFDCCIYSITITPTW